MIKITNDEARLFVSLLFGYDSPGVRWKLDGVDLTETRKRLQEEIREVVE